MDIFGGDLRTVKCVRDVTKKKAMRLNFTAEVLLAYSILSFALRSVFWAGTARRLAGIFCYIAEYN